MKKITILLLLLMFSLSSNAQMLLHNDELYPTTQNIPSSPAFGNNVNASSATNPALTIEKKVYNIFFHVVTPNNGIATIGENEIMDVVRNLNVAFNKFNIFFKYTGANTIPASQFVEINSYPPGTTPALPTADQLLAYSISNNFQETDAINIFVVNKMFQNGSGTPQTLPGLSGNSSNPNIFLSKAYFTSPVAVHEMGHIFGLEHTNRNGFGPQTNGATNCEHVVRSGPSYNADDFGDRIADTYASPTYYADAEVSNTGVYIGTGTDCIFTNYTLFPVPIKNFMNVNREEDIIFQSQFSSQQGEKMRAFREISLNISSFNSFKNDVASLYEPYYQQFIVTNTVVSVQDQPQNGGALVCYKQIYRLKFQKGFDYKFSNTEPVSPMAASVNTLFVYDERPNHSIGVKIIQIDPNIIQNTANLSVLSPSCKFEPYTSGKIYSTEVLGSMNITEQELNETQVKNPSLYDELLQNYYYILNKYTESGATSQDVFYKP